MSWGAFSAAKTKNAPGRNRRRIWERKIRIRKSICFQSGRTRPPNRQPATAITRTTTQRREDARRILHLVVPIKMAIHEYFSIPTSKVGYYAKDYKECLRLCQDINNFLFIFVDYLFCNSPYKRFNSGTSTPKFSAQRIGSPQIASISTSRPACQSIRLDG